MNSEFAGVTDATGGTDTSPPYIRDPDNCLGDRQQAGKISSVLLSGGPLACSVSGCFAKIIATPEAAQAGYSPFQRHACLRTINWVQGNAGWQTWQSQSERSTAKPATPGGLAEKTAGANPVTLLVPPDVVGLSAGAVATAAINAQAELRAEPPALEVTGSALLDLPVLASDAAPDQSPHPAPTAAPIPPPTMLTLPA